MVKYGVHLIFTFKLTFPLTDFAALAGTFAIGLAGFYHNIIVRVFSTTVKLNHEFLRYKLFASVKFSINTLQNGKIM